MTDSATQARPALPEQVMDEALDWLIALESPTPAQCQAFDAWLASDPQHADAYARASAAWSHPAVAAAAAAVAKAPPAARRRRPWRRFAAAAVLILGIAGLGPGNLALRLQADHLTAIGERQRLQLDDGTQVMLNTESALSSQARPGARSARLYEGEAWFNVPGRASPLELRAGAVLAQANGSTFSVRLLNGQTRVQVESGQVDLQDDQHQRLSLPAGMAVNVDNAGFGSPAPLHPDEDLAWTRGRLVFVNCPLRQVLADLSRYYPGWILNTRPALDERRVTGNYSVEDPVAVMRALAQVTAANLREFPALLILD